MSKSLVGDDTLLKRAEELDALDAVRPGSYYNNHE